FMHQRPRRSPLFPYPTPFRSMVFHHDGVDLVPLIPNVPVTIGRGSRADASFRGAQLSRHHARFELIDGVVWVEDLKSTNGTLIEDRKSTRLNSSHVKISYAVF